ncbi:DoxX family protein [Bradyrhizobium sp. AZCC 2262]|uniref:DoxX family protein n=1 Tax=Bradyrhizobium sp. AZCC 2262 TaxID=3117022 RepID=UPI002FF408BB
MLSILLAVVLVRAGWLNPVAPDFIRAEFKAWGYSDSLRKTVGALEWISAAALLMPPLRMIGCAVAIAITLGVLVTLSRQREFMRLEYPVVLMALVLLVVVDSLITRV